MTATKAWIVTGKFTDDAANVYRRADGSWSRDAQQAGVVADEATAKAQAAHAVAHEQRQITDPYVIEVAVDGSTIDLLTARERIRATGPTVRLRRPDAELGRQGG